MVQLLPLTVCYDLLCFHTLLFQVVEYPLGPVVTVPEAVDLACVESRLITSTTFSTTVLGVEDSLVELVEGSH